MPKECLSPKDREIVQVNSESTLNELRVGNYAIWADLEKLMEKLLIFPTVII